MNTQDRYQNKLFSVLGDSISTLAGYSEPGDAAYYDGMRKFEANVFLPEDTWWGQVVKRVGGEILVNNSISGSMVCKHRRCEVPSYGCSDERTSALGQNGLTPDVIMIFMGTNDWGGSMKPTPSVKAHETDLAIFSVAYQRMLDNLHRNYPEAELWCFTLAVSTCTSKEDFAFPYRYAGRHIEEYCAVIRSCAETYGCRVIDMYETAAPYDTIDGFHPNADGMKTLADAVISQLQ